MKLTVFLKTLFRESPVKITLMILCVMLAGIAEGCGILLFLPLIKAFSSTSITNLPALGNWIPSVTDLLICILVFFALKNLFIYVQRQFTEKAAVEFELKLKNGLMASLFASRWSFFSAEKTGELANAIGQNSLGAANAYRLLILFTSEIFSVVIYCVVGLVVAWKAFLLCAALGVLCSWPLKSTVRNSKKTSTRVVAMQNTAQNLVLENLLTMKFIKGNRLENERAKAISSAFHELAAQEFKACRYASITETLPDFMVAVVVCGILYMSHTFFKVPVENVFVLIAVMYRLIRRILSLQVTRQRTMIYLPYFEHCEKIAAAAASHEEKTGHKPFLGIANSIRFENVGFAYGDKVVVEKVNFQIKKNDLTALVGKSGAGKTTILDLLLGLLQPMHGKILIDNEALNDLNIFSWRSKISYVPQEAPLINASVADNIRLGNAGISDREMKESARLAHADEFITKLPQGYNTLIGERGLTLSGGQRQRLAIARALATKPELLILDEATSALDSDSERMVQSSIQELKGKTTILLVAHRFSTIEQADIIYVLDEKTIVDSGPKDLLLSQSKIFKRLYADKWSEAKC